MNAPNPRVPATRTAALQRSFRDWVDTTEVSLRWLLGTTEKLKVSGPPPLGTHLLMGSTARLKLENVIRNLREGRLVVYQACAEKL